MNGNNSETKYAAALKIQAEKVHRGKIASQIFMAIIFLGALGVGTALVLSETLYPEIEEFIECPTWYRVFMYCSLAFIAFGIVGCAFTKNRRNTTKLECNIELWMFLVGFVCEICLALARDESKTKFVLICIAGAISLIGFFCGIGSFVGRLKYPRGVYSHIYRELISHGTMENKNFPENKPALLMDIIEVENYFCTMLPIELVDYLLEFNGDNRLMFSAEEIIKVTQSIRETFVGEKFKGIEKFCFFGGDGTGNSFCYKISDDGSIKSGVFYWNRRDNIIQPFAASLKDLIINYYSGKMIFE